MISAAASAQSHGQLSQFFSALSLGGQSSVTSLNTLVSLPASWADLPVTAASTWSAVVAQVDIDVQGRLSPIQASLLQTLRGVLRVLLECCPLNSLSALAEWLAQLAASVIPVVSAQSRWSEWLDRESCDLLSSELRTWLDTCQRVQSELSAQLDATVSSTPQLHGLAVFTQLHHVRQRACALLRIDASFMSGQPLMLDHNQPLWHRVTAVLGARDSGMYGAMPLGELL